MLPFDDLVKICSDFFTVKEVIAARTLIGQFLPDKRMAVRQGSDRDKVTKTLTDIVKVVLDPANCNIPRFYAMDLSRLPPVSVDHVDVSAILQELVALRQEVQTVAQHSCEAK